MIILQIDKLNLKKYDRFIPLRILVFGCKMGRGKLGNGDRLISLIHLNATALVSVVNQYDTIKNIFIGKEIISKSKFGNLTPMITKCVCSYCWQ